MGVTYHELKCWCELTGEHLTAWEIDTLKFLSDTYAAETMRSSKEDARSPIDFEDRAAKNKRLDAVFK